MAWREEARFGNVEASGPVTAAGGVVLPTYTTATLPSAATGTVVICSDGNGGAATLAHFNGTNWLDSDGDTCSAS